MDNEKNIYKPEFIPFYLEEVNKYGLTLMEGLIYGFIRFYTKTGNQFYFKSKDFADIVGSTENMINKTLKKLEDKGLIIRETKNVGFKKIRLVKVNMEPNQGVSTNLTQELGPELTQELDKKEYIKKNNKKEYIYSKIKGGEIAQDFFANKNEEVIEAWNEYIAIRKKKKLPVTDRVIKRLIKRLEEYSNGDTNLMLEIIEKAIMGGRQNFYRIDNNKNPTKKTDEILEENKIYLENIPEEEKKLVSDMINCYRENNFGGAPVYKQFGPDNYKKYKDILDLVRHNEF